MKFRVGSCYSHWKRLRIEYPYSFSTEIIGHSILRINSAATFDHSTLVKHIVSARVVFPSQNFPMIEMFLISFVWYNFMLSVFKMLMFPFCRFRRRGRKLDIVAEKTNPTLCLRTLLSSTANRKQCFFVTNAHLFSLYPCPSLHLSIVKKSFNHGWKFLRYYASKRKSLRKKKVLTMVEIFWINSQKESA